MTFWVCASAAFSFWGEAETTMTGISWPEYLG
jgi:hypothetical protein